ncbi:hypothetical protein LZF95_04265 [Algoriphagus sp. AGSA1]|uniref:hypothetical protein n=1 Tax=Algoriphagus sp. AGSA1 TaxID=2907213 RepID=UPI001F365B18|nr:hypothetical protein [Algoriphagus sp. AGSA1]MCE7053882.1 hypothetical protein [Algoriphagus sp. AGSA1]
MKIEIRKKTNHQCAYLITRNDHSTEQITVETKTYLLHDICHFAVEKKLKYEKGFWGMQAQGYRFNRLFGKDNPQSNELRFIELRSCYNLSIQDILLNTISIKP